MLFVQLEESIERVLTDILLDKIKKITHGNTEQEQAFVRVCLMSAIVSYFFIATEAGMHLPDISRVVAFTYWAISIPWLAWIIYKPEVYKGRRVAITIADQLLIAFFVSYGGNSIPVIALSFWVIIGSAFRYGFFYLYLSAASSMIGLIYNINFSQSWIEHSNFGWGVFFSVIVVVFYTSVFLRRAAESSRRLNESLDKLNLLARIDNLTGLPNRLALIERLSQSIAMAKRMHTCLSILYFDLDGFKRVNDTMGHIKGDDLLKEVAKNVKSAIRATDTLARLGGDEFVIILENTRIPDDSEMIAQKILSVISKIEIHGESNIGKEVMLQIGASIGVTTYSSDSDFDLPTVEALIDQADNAMYLAKKAGKGCWRFWRENTCCA